LSAAWSRRAPPVDPMAWMLTARKPARLTYANVARAVAVHRDHLKSQSADGETRPMRGRDATAFACRVLQRHGGIAPTDSMRQLAGACRAWAAAAGNASSRQHMENEARHWIRIANAIDRRVADGRVELVDDLHAKLN
jgi:hypothetical protein